MSESRRTEGVFVVGFIGTKCEGVCAARGGLRLAFAFAVSDQDEHGSHRRDTVFGRASPRMVVGEKIRLFVCKRCVYNYCAVFVCGLCCWNQITREPPSQNRKAFRLRRRHVRRKRCFWFLGDTTCMCARTAVRACVYICTCVSQNNPAHQCTSLLCIFPRQRTPNGLGTSPGRRSRTSRRSSNSSWRP